MTSISVSGFVPSDLSLNDVERANCGAGSTGYDRLDNERILLLSNLNKSDTPPSVEGRGLTRRKRTKNRKEVSISSMFKHNGVSYPINNALTYGVYPKILHKSLDQLDICQNKWRRVFVIRFDLHQRFYTADNKMVSRFRKNLSRRIEREYKIFEMGYLWVREQEKAKSQHYHMAIFLDGDKINHSASISIMIAAAWKGLKLGNSVHLPDKRFYNIVDDESKAQVVYRLSYLAKQRGKGYRPPQTKDYGTSRLIAPSCYNFNTGAKVT